MAMSSGARMDDERAGAARPKLRIGIHRLPAPDIMLVRAFVQMSGTFTADFPWVFADEPPFDLVMIDANDPQRVRDTARSLAGELLLVTDGTVYSPDMMQRPLRFRVLEDWLKQKADEMARERRQQPAAAAAPGIADFYVRKLDRWPPRSLLSHDRLRLRVATMLTANSMNLSDLARLCRQPEDEVRDCVLTFRDAGLLQIEPIARKAAPAASQAPATADSTRKSKPGLIASIRRRLGL